MELKKTKLFPIGLICVAVSGDCVTKIYLSDTEYFDDSPVIDEAFNQLSEYFEGRRREFDLKLKYDNATPFQAKVYDALKNTEYGKCITYKDLAILAGNKNAARAVGGALNKNPIMIVIPCHRVIAKNNIGGFAYGLKIKKMLLSLEGNKSEDLA